MICKKGLVLFLFPHKTNIQNIYSFKVLNTIFLHNLWLTVTHKRRFRDSQIVIITNFVVVSSVGVKRVVCINLQI